MTLCHRVKFVVSVDQLRRMIVASRYHPTAYGWEFRNEAEHPLWLFLPGFRMNVYGSDIVNKALVHQEFEARGGR